MIRLTWWGNNNKYEYYIAKIVEFDEEPPVLLWVCGFSSNDNNLSAIRNNHNVFQTKIEKKIEIAGLSILEEMPDDQRYAAAVYAIINELHCDRDNKKSLKYIAHGAY